MSDVVMFHDTHGQRHTELDGKGLEDQNTGKLEGTWRLEDWGNGGLEHWKTGGPATRSPDFFFRGLEDHVDLVEAEP